MSELSFEQKKWESSKGDTIQTYALIPDQPQLLVFHIHGLGEHVGRYLPWASRFFSKHIAWISFDLPGHGGSTGKRGHFSSLADLLDLFEELQAHFRALYPELGFVLYGHSMGGNLALQYLLERNPSFKGAIISSPWIRLVEEPSALLIAIARTLNRFAGGISLDSGLNPNHMSTISAVCDDYRNDPLNHRRISIASFVMLYESGLSLLHPKATLNLPVYLFHSRLDPLTSFEASQQFASKHPDQVSFYDYSEGFHELHNDTTQSDLFERLNEWLKSL